MGKSNYPYHPGRAKKQQNKSRGIRKIIFLIILIALAFAAYKLVICNNSEQNSSPNNQHGQSTEQDVHTIEKIDGTELPAYSGTPYVKVNDNFPNFAAKELTTNSFEGYGKLDTYGRCTYAKTCLSEETMPAQNEEREDISEVHPSGWVSGQNWERCHLIGWQLSAENANDRNLITGTHYLNVEGMLQFENKVAQYIRDTGNHVLYEAKPIYDGDNLVASGVQIRAESVEDKGKGVSFNVYCFNITPDCEIDYKTGIVLSGEDKARQNEVRKYVLNTNSMTFHYPSCSAAQEISDNNREVVEMSRKQLIDKGYLPCGYCEP